MKLSDNNLETSNYFATASGSVVPSLSEEQMREVDRVAVEEFDLGILQMMENAGRNLALMITDILQNEAGQITILAGTGGNGGGGICCARHLLNHNYNVNLILTKDPDAFTGAAKTQLAIVQKSGLIPTQFKHASKTIKESIITIDALIGYSLKGAPYGSLADLIKIANQHSRHILALDIPSGLDSTTGEIPGNVIMAERTLTLALPKIGLQNLAAGDLYVADIGIPPEVYHSIGIQFDPFFGDNYLQRIYRSNETH